MAARPNHPALVWQGEVTTYAELGRRVDAVAGTLARWLDDEGDLSEDDAAAGDGAASRRIAVAMGNSPDFVALVHASQRLGAVVAPLNPELTARELAAQLGYVRPAVVVADAANADLVADALREAGHPDVPVVTSVERATARVGRLRETALIHEALAVVFTSGTSARPRGVIVTHGNAAWSAAASALRLGHDPADRWLAVLPLFHMGGLSILLRAAWYATTVELQREFDPVRAAVALGGEVTLASLVPTMLRRVLEVWPPRSAHDARSLRAVLVGGGPLSGTLVAAARSAGIPVCPSYGLTEASSQVATQVPWESGIPAVGLSGSVAMPRDRPDALAAPPMPFTTIRIERAGVEAAPGEEGDILVAGPTVMPGYFARPNATAGVLVDGWLRTGDMGSLGHDGRLRVTGRRRDRIVTGGENVTPAEVEEVLEADPAVAEACVVGVPSEEWGTAVAAALVARHGANLDTEAMLDRVRAQLAAYKLPKMVRWVDSLPRTASGKVRRGEVAVMFGAPRDDLELPDLAD